MKQIEQSPIEISHYQIFRKKYYGKGQYGTVYGCTDTQKPDLQLCSKVLRVEDVDQLILKREIDILKLLMPIQRENLNLIQVYDVLDDKVKGIIYIIMELCQEGDLKQLMDKRKKKNQGFTVEEATSIVAQIANGYRTLFKCKIIHRDIKPANILISNGVYKIADLGMGRVIEDMNYAKNFTKVGTPAYAAPQLFLESAFSSKADVYSLGVIFYQLIYGQLPIEAKTQPELLQKLRNLKVTPKLCDETSQSGVVPQHVRDLIQRMLSYDENDRCSWQDVFNSTVLNEYLTPQQQQAISKNPLVSKSSIQYQDFYRVDEISNNKILQIIRILTTKCDLANKCHKYLQESKQNQNQNQFPLKLEEFVLLSVCISGYRYKLIQNILGLLLNQYHQLIPQLQSIISPQELQDNCQNQDANSKHLKEYIQKTLNSSILLFREDECKFFNCGVRVHLPYVKDLKKILEDDDDTNYIFFAETFQKFYENFKKSFDSIQESNKKLQELLKKMNIIESEYPIEVAQSISPTKILEKSQTIN
ncbi:unnamed protein product [Paramecium sonneborni]|uniref:Protein kinase domain-containing protein n=1 Tax=Paramecium sonneborni TaxID=65129 RepID=A0A8S1RKU0_9CILI|nr:unnamed protein product [Paramecium sonneborni]